MSQKIAIAAIHGIGEAKPKWKDETDKKFISGMTKPLISEFAQLRGETFEEAKSKLVIKPIYWADIIQELSDELSRRLNLDSLSNPLQLRDFVFHYLGDAIAYSTPGDKKVSNSIHEIFAKTLTEIYILPTLRAISITYSTNNSSYLVNNTLNVTDTLFKPRIISLLETIV